MAKYAYYNSNILPNDQIIGWIDSDVEQNMPPASDLLALTDAQWQTRGSDIFYVVDGALTGSKNILTLVKTVQISSLSKSCQQQIISGFTSSTLGSPYTYASGDIDQRNIVQSAQSTKGGLLACQNAAGVWGIEPHTQDQSQQVLEDFVAARDTTRLKLVGLVAKVNAATTVEEVQAIVWVDDDATQAAATATPPSKASKKTSS